MKIKKKTLIHFLMMLAMFAILEPSAFNGTLLHTVDGYIRTIAFLVSIPIYFIDKQFRNATENLLLAFILLMGLSTLTYFGSLTDDCSFFIRICVAAVVLIKYMFGQDPIRTCRDMGFMLSVFLVFDALTWVLPGLGNQVGASIRCFLGTKTTITYYLLPALAFDYAFYQICTKKQKRFGRLLFLMAIGGTFAYLIQMPISTTIVCLVLCIVLLRFSYKDNFALDFVSKYGLLITLIINIMFIAGMAGGIFNYIITTMLRESTDLTGRIQIWQMAFLYIAGRPILGYGMSTGIYLSVWQATNVSAHNLLVGILMKTGFVGAILFYGILFYFQMINRNKDIRNKVLCLFMVGMIVILNIEGISEDFISYPVTFCMLSLIGNTKKIQEELESK